MPQAPNVDGLPLWLQVLVSMAFVLATAIAALHGYRRQIDREPPGAAQTLMASFPDMQPVRHLADVCTELLGAVGRLDGSIQELVHHERNHIESERELCQRLRELREVLDGKRR